MEYNNRGRIDEIDTYVDINVFKGTNICEPLMKQITLGGIYNDIGRSMYRD